MYLKRLDIQGFKSFATRTTFEFGHGMTAIVGPNGAGKSNIADALRWVLGEQSGRLLRASKLDDIIYAGSAKRSATEKVEVTLTLDNTDAWLPLEFREVAISRRGYRSGESEYRINRKRIRLRDLQSLLARANAGQNSYAIIGQGLVESVLNLRPEERRQLIEEAADIQRYRLKIEDAYSKLAATHENVERIRLLIKEIRPQLAQLERQAKRAGEHARLSHELSVALHAYYGHRWHHANETLIVSRAEHDQAQAELIQAKVALDTCQWELADISSQLEEQRRAAAAGAAERDRLDQRLREMEQRLAVAEDRRAILAARQRELQDELTSVEAERDRATAGLAAADARRAELDQAVATAGAVRDGRQAELDALDGEFRDGQARAIDTEARSKRLQTAAADLKARLQRLSYSQRDMERQVASLDIRRRSLISQMAEHLRILRSYRAQDSLLTAEVSHTSTRRQALETEVQEVRRSLAKVEANQNARRGKLEALEARLDILGRAQKQIQTQPENSATVEGVQAAITAIIRVPQGLEEAIAAALADQLDALVFERQTEAIAAVEARLEQRGPRLTLLPLDTMKQVYPLNLMREKSVLGVASRLVKYPPRYEKLVSTLLGRTIIVQDTATAVRVLRRGMGNVVTLDGVVFHASGSITVGQAEAGRPFILGYERDLESIPKEIDRVRRSLAITDRELLSLQDRLRQDESDLAGLNREAEDSMERRLRLQDSLAQRQQQLARLKGELRGLIGSQAVLRDQERSFAQEAERLEQEREGLLAEAKEAQGTSGYLTRANVIVEQRRESLLAAADEATAEHARLDGEHRSLAIQREGAQAALARLEAQTSAKALQLHDLETELAALESGGRSDRDGLAEAREQLEPFLGTNQPGQETGRHLEARRSDLHPQVLRAQSRLFDAERYAQESEAQVRRWQSEIDTIRVRIQEDGLLLTPEGDIQPVETIALGTSQWLAAERPPLSPQKGPDEGPSDMRMRPVSGGATVDPEDLGRDIDRLRAQLRNLGPVNVEAQTDYQQLRDRHDFLASQLDDLAGAEISLHHAIEELNKVMRGRFESTFAQVADGFEQYFQAFFGGGQAKLTLTNEDDPSASGVEIEARPPGKRLQTLAQLSGGEKALTAVALLFALLQTNPSPFCVLDEVDAMLDDANVGRFVAALQALSQRTQFIVITHNRKTIEVADSIYGVSMGPDAASRVLSMRLADVAAN